MRDNVYTPGAGNLPPVLAGRDQLLHELAGSLNAVAGTGRPHARDVIIVGPRGVGKTVTLTTYGRLAAQAGFEVVNLQAVAGHAGLVESLLQRAASRVDKNAGPWTRAKHAFDRIAGISFGVAGLSAAITTYQPGGGSRVLDPGTLAEALAELASEVRRDTPTGGLLITVDELQVASAADLALLAATLHRLNVDHPHAAVVFAGTGLPHTPDALRTAGVTHPDRLFLLEQLPVTLEEADARFAIIEPARRVGANWHPDAASAVVAATNGYPAHLQQLAHTVWDLATGPTLITVEDVRRAIPRFEADLNRRTLGPRWNRMSDRQMEYLAALALHGGTTSTAHLATTLARPLSELSWIRHDLIREGDIYTLQRGHVALAIPIFAPYILARYDQARATADITLLSLEDMRRNDPAAPPAARPPATNPPRPAVPSADPRTALMPPPAADAHTDSPDSDPHHDNTDHSRAPHPDLDPDA